MTALVIILTLVFIAIIVVQIGKLTDLAAKIRGEEVAERESNNRNAVALYIFMVIFLIACVGSAIYYAPQMLGYGPHIAASEHGKAIDNSFNITLFFTGIVFILTQILLFYYAWKYRHQKGRKALYMPHDNRLEVVWTVIPAVVMSFLVVNGLMNWNKIMADVGANEEHMEIEAMGQQFLWSIRYPGADTKLGERDFRLISDLNPFGQNWKDEKNHDDFHPSEIWLPVDKKVRVRITARDVLHNFYIPHMRVKMDAVPGMPTYFVFTPTITTEEYRERLSKLPEWNKPADPTEPDGLKRWETFEYELACAELCGNGHFSMKRIVKVVSQEEYDVWVKQQTENGSYYQQNISKEEVVSETPTEDENAETTEETSTEETTDEETSDAH